MGFDRGATNITPEKSTVTKPPEPMDKGHGGGQYPHRVVASVKKKMYLHNEDCQNMYASPDIMMISFKREEMSGAYGLIRNSCRDLVERLDGRPRNT
jgi:hypothetical protein